MYLRYVGVQFFFNSIFSSIFDIPNNETINIIINILALLCFIDIWSSNLDQIVFKSYLYHEHGLYSTNLTISI